MSGKCALPLQKFIIFVIVYCSICRLIFRPRISQHIRCVAPPLAVLHFLVALVGSDSALTDQAVQAHPAAYNPLAEPETEILPVHHAHNLEKQSRLGRARRGVDGFRRHGYLLVIVVTHAE